MLDRTPDVDDSFSFPFFHFIFIYLHFQIVFFLSDNPPGCLQVGLNRCYMRTSGAEWSPKGPSVLTALEFFALYSIYLTNLKCCTPSWSHRDAGHVDWIRLYLLSFDLRQTLRHLLFRSTHRPCCRSAPSLYPTEFEGLCVDVELSIYQISGQMKRNPTTVGEQSL